MLTSELETIGLSEKEAKVYVASLELGKATAQEVAKKADLKRPTTYFTIEGLMNMGLMSSVHEGKKQFFMAENPERLEEVYKAKQDELKRQGEKLKSMIPELKKIKQKDAEPVVKYYTGKEGVLSMVKDLLNVSEGEDIYIAYDLDKVDTLFTDEESKSIRFSKHGKDIHIHALYVSDHTVLEDTETSSRMKIDRGEYPLSADIAVYGNKIRLASLDEQVLGIVIENEKLAESLKTILKLAWKGASEK
jgi:sugar-specific transcriptional regulator TrmB